MEFDIGKKVINFACGKQDSYGSLLTAITDKTNRNN